MLDDPAVTIQTEDVHASIVPTFWPTLKAVENDEVAFRNDALHIDTPAELLTRLFSK